ncbi:MAG TPA: hypothetical protein V6D20_20095 [Candidatus Obscuribacterales bacterium]
MGHFSHTNLDIKVHVTTILRLTTMVLLLLPRDGPQCTCLLHMDLGRITAATAMVTMEGLLLQTTVDLLLQEHFLLMINVGHMVMRDLAAHIEALLQGSTEDHHHLILPPIVATNKEVILTAGEPPHFNALPHTQGCHPKCINSKDLLLALLTTGATWNRHHNSIFNNNNKQPKGIPLAELSLLPLAALLISHTERWILLLITLPRILLHTIIMIILTSTRMLEFRGVRLIR